VLIATEIGPRSHVATWSRHGRRRFASGIASLDDTGGVASWATFVGQAPELAEVAARLWPGIHALDGGEPVASGQPYFAISYLATVRPDGSPRLHPFCPVLASGRLFAAIPHSSPKGEDLRRDGRCVIHALPGPDDDELCLRATAVEVTADGVTRALLGRVVRTSAVGGMIETVSNDPLFEFDVEQVDVAFWVDIGQPGTRAVRRRWRAR
jgi:hypothetical protein